MIILKMGNSCEFPKVQTKKELVFENSNTMLISIVHTI